MTECASSRADQQAALEHLAGLLDPRWFATTLVTGQRRSPRLTITARHARLAVDVHAGEGWYLAAGETRIAPVTDPGTAAAELARVLCGEPGTADRLAAR